MKDIYFVIRNSDGDTTVRTLNKKQLLEYMKDGDFGNNGEDILDEIPENADTNYWGEGVLIIKGHQVSPTAKQTVVEFDIE